MTPTRRAGLAGLALTFVLAAALPAAASTWCGENGLIRLSLAAGDSLQPVVHAAPGADGLTRVTLQAWLTDVDPVAVAGEAFLAIGGYEFALEIEGAEAFVLGTTLPEGAVNLAKEHLAYVIGMQQPLKLDPEGTLLGTWELAFQGEPRDVRFGIAPEGVVSCGGTEGCAGSGTRLLYVGSYDAGMLGEVFGAGCAPAWLNPATEPDLTPRRGDATWQDVGRATARERRF